MKGGKCSDLFKNINYARILFFNMGMLLGDCDKYTTGAFQILYDPSVFHNYLITPTVVKPL